MSFVNALTSYARRKKIFPNEVYANALRTKMGLMEQSIFRRKTYNTQRDPFAGLSSRELYMRRPVE